MRVYILQSSEDYRDISNYLAGFLHFIYELPEVQGASMMLYEGMSL